MRIAISRQKDFANPQSINTGTLYTLFRPYFDIILTAESFHHDPRRFVTTYVPSPEAEIEIGAALDASVDTTLAITGAKGIGKSTLLRHLYGLTPGPTIREKTLVIPFFIDSVQTTFENSTVEKIITKQISAAARMAREKFNVSEAELLLAKFIEGHKPQLLEFFEIDRNASLLERLAELRKTNRYAYVAEDLKYSVQNSEIEQILLIVDDIESAPFDDQKSLVHGVLKFRDCLKNVGENRNYRTNYIFTCRPYTYELLKTSPDVTSFDIRKRVDIEKPVDLNEVIARRFALTVDEVGEARLSKAGVLQDATEIARWRGSFEALMAVLQEITNRFGAVVTDLCNHNVRNSLSEIQHVLKNSRWYEVAPPVEGSFDISEENYRKSEAGFFRALVLKDRDCYTSNSYSCVANVFHNFRDEPRADLLVINIIRILLRSNNGVLEESELKERLLIAYDAEIIREYYDDAKKFAVNSELIVAHYTKDEVLSKSYLKFEATSQGKTIFRLLRKSCILLEFFRDDTFLKHMNSKKSMLSSLNSITITGDRRFYAVIEFISEIIDMEILCTNHVIEIKKESNYRRYYGESISSVLIIGAGRSARRYYRGDISKAPSIPDQLKKRFISVREKLAKSSVGSISSRAREQKY